MLSRTTTLIWCRCVLSSVPRLPPIRHPHLTQLPLHLTRSYAKKPKKVPLPPEQLPDHLKQVILGKYLTPNPDTGKLYLKDIEAIRAENNKRLKGHKKGELYMNSMHGRAELISLVMKAIDRSEVQKEWKTNGKLRFLPSHQFYLARAYWILQGPGKWMDRPLPEKLEPEQGHRVKPNRYTLWNSWKYLLDNEATSFGNFTGETATRANLHFRQFLEKYTDVRGSKTAKEWPVEMDRELSELHHPDAKKVSRRIDKETNRMANLVAQKKAEPPLQPSPNLEPPIPIEEPVEDPTKTLEERPEGFPEEEVPEIWKPNQKDITLRQSTFSHPSQTTLMEAYQQIHSQWAPHTFHDMSLVPALPGAIEKITLGHLSKDVIGPTAIQALAIPVITKLDTTGFGDEKPAFQSFLIASETGSGKTLAYLVPLINRLKAEEAWAEVNPTSEKAISNTHRAASPRAVILVPTSELAEQIYQILKRLTHEIKLRVSALLPKISDSVFRKSVLPRYIDILISTPHRLNEFIQNDELKSNHIKYLVIDEADTIFDRSFLDSLNPILYAVRLQLTHLVLSTATIPLALEERLSKSFPHMQRIVTHKIHTVSRRLKLHVIIEQDKRKALVDALRSIQQDNTEPNRDIKRALVFCNDREGVRGVYEFLKSTEMVSVSKGNESIFELIPFTRDNFDRHTALERFNAPTEEKSDKLRILITTDMGSRGLDTISSKSVILYDVPYSSIDLLHRLGRTARVGMRGRAWLLVSGAEYRGRTREWVNEIRDRMIKGEALV